MYFHTWPFALFFLVFYPIYLVSKDTRVGLVVLVAASYVFYAFLNPLYLALIAYSTVVDYAVVGRMAAGPHRGSWLCASVLNNLFLLGFFKYGAFVTDNVNACLSALGIPYVLPAPGLLLPAGLSFYIFQSMSYVIDFYRGRIEREPSLLRYAAFVSLFPRLLAGPIERAGNLLVQLRRRPAIRVEDFADGLSLFAVGLFKKVALADYLAIYVDKVYGAPGDFQSPALMLATFFFAWQIYFDFSGYTDMARGIGRMMGLRLMLNFDNPYLAAGLGEFWRRWHISLSSWFKDYLYIPLGGNRRGRFATYRNMFVTMVVSGLWHGASWTFVLWGAVHAAGRFLTRELERTTFYQRRIPRLVKQLAVFSFVTFAWIFFRAESISDARLVIDRIFTAGWGDPECPLVAVGLILAAWLYQFAWESRLRPVLERPAVRFTAVVSMILYVALFAPSGAEPFIYLRF